MTVRTLALVLLGIVIMSTVGCDPGTSGERKSASSTALAAIGDGEWDLRVDRALYERPGVVRLPSDTLTEADFQPASAGPTYRVVVSERGSRVTIRGVFSEGDLFEGHRTAVTDGRIEYGLGEIASGGRFIVWPAQGGLQAEMAIYGSGRAFLRCMRGPLARVP